jgi:signal transduction histidine kinase
VETMEPRRLFGRMSPRTRKVLTWGAAVAFPLVLYGTLLSERQDQAGLRILAPALVLGLPAVLLRRRPLVALALMIAGSYFSTLMLNAWEIPYLQFLAVDMAVCFIAVSRPRRTSVTAAVMALSALGDFGIYRFPVRSVPGPVFAPAPGKAITGTVFLALTIAISWMIGNSMRQRRMYAEALHAQAAVQAVTAERLRIARELHDMVAHSIGVIAIQAGVGGRVIDTQPVEARNALSAIEATSRETLSGLRRMLGALRQADQGTAAAPLDSAPGLADLDRLVATTRGAGVRVEVRQVGEARPLPADIDLSAFRIIQEAVTNVVRHAETGHCRVTVEHGEGEVVIEIVDDGRGGSVADIGFGIVGMRERVGLLHGRFAAGPRPEGGFAVTARLPVPAGVR